MLWALIWTFFKIGLVSFGGGYAILSVIEREVVSQQWITSVDFAHTVALAGMAPGPIATNSAVLIGYKVAGIGGAVAATFGMILPSFIIIIALSLFFFKVGRERLLQMIFYGLKPMVAALIIYAAIRVGVNGQPLMGMNLHTLGVVLIFIFAMIGTMKYRMHPLVVLSGSALMGIAFFM
ncbi:chromate transporter [Paenibacillus agricola]|uniref:Chromate transporter n=1 Tax=Paenibacillus agricola TaxID=2716264 RepID=A0ABX0J3H6_9BACL|nr:chromate transporter [Paenibacillus agricola]NHN30213.1 chromate transporter [Paenibacillus agricola]